MSVVGGFARTAGVVVVALTAGLAAAGCSSSSSAAGRVATSTTLSTTTTSTVAPTTAAPTTAPVPGHVFTTPAAAAAAIYSAWTHHSRAVADLGRMAPSAELDKLFSQPPVSPQNRGCDDGNFGRADCFFGNGHGGVDIGLVPGGGGWQVTSIVAYS